MASRTVYANLQDGLQNLSLWDQSLADMGNLGAIPCTAVGTNTIVLTPIASVFAPTVTAPQSLQNFSFIAAGTSSAPITIQIGTTAALKLYRLDGLTQATTSDLTINVVYIVSYNAALNGAVGGFQLMAPTSNIAGATITGATIIGATITTSTYNGNTWTAGTGILTIAALKTLTVNNSLAFSGTDGTVMTFPGTSDTVVTLAAAQALTNKTYNGNTWTAGTGTLSLGNNTLAFSGSGVTITLAGVNGSTVTFQGTDTYVGRATTDTLTNKTFDTAGAGNSFKINGVAITANTGTGANVLATSPTLVTPVLGVATATSINGNTFTTGTYTLTGAAGKTFTFSNSLTFAGTDGTTQTFQASDTIVGRATTDTLTNKTIDTNANTINLSGSQLTRGQVPGTPTNDSAAAGYIGEVISSSVAGGSAIALTTNVAANVTSITLTAGDWDVFMFAGFAGGATTSQTSLIASMSTTSAALDTTTPFGSNTVSTAAQVVGGATNNANAGPLRVQILTGNTLQIFFVVRASFTVSTMSAFGAIRARRVR